MAPAEPKPAEALSLRSLRVWKRERARVRTTELGSSLTQGACELHAPGSPSRCASASQSRGSALGGFIQTNALPPTRGRLPLKLLRR